MNYAIITGASSGIGYATADCFLAHHWQVINISRTPCSHKNVININFDLSSTDYSDLEKAIIPLLINPTKICFVHNAGMTTSDTIQNIELNTFQTLLQVNLISAVVLANMLINHMNQGSSIILIGSTLSEKSVPNSCSYTVTKHALLGLMRSISQDIGKEEIHSCCICPGPTDTIMLKQVAKDNQMTLKEFEKIQLMNRLITPQEIAEVVYFCATHPVINGDLIHANLGQRSA